MKLIFSPFDFLIEQSLKIWLQGKGESNCNGDCDWIKGKCRDHGDLNDLSLLFSWFNKTIIEGDIVP